MKSLSEFINEHKQDMTSQIIMIMGTPGCGKTYWMQHNGINFFKKQGITLNPMELDIDHTLKKFQLEAFPDFCKRVLNYKNTTIINKKTGDSVHNNKEAWSTFINNEQENFEKLNKKFGGNDSNVPDLSKIDYGFCSPYISRYYNAADDNKSKIVDVFVNDMKKKYFNSIFASDFSVRGEAKEEYNDALLKKIKNTDSDVFIAISGAKMKTIDEISKLCPENATCRIVYLHGNVDKAVQQDSKRERSGGEEFVRSYAARIDNVWDELLKTYKDKGIYKIYELTDNNDKNVDSFPDWELTKTYD